jgi:hypothetical protein
MSPGDTYPSLIRPVGGVLLAALIALALAPGARAEGGPSIVAGATPGEIPIGGSSTLSGHLSGEPAAIASQPLQLEAAPYPYRAYAVIDRSQSAADGTFAFAAISPRSNTRLRVSVPASGGALSPIVRVTVDPRVAIHARSLGPGRERLSLRIEHTVSPHTRTTRVYWYLARRHSTRLALATSTSSREIAPGVTYASAIVNPPAKSFSYRVCMHPGWEAAMGPASTHGSCLTPDIRALGFSGEGRGIPRPPYPSAGAIAAARAFLEGRAGATAFAVVDSTGHLSGLNLREHFQTASVIKVMFLTAYLQKLAVHHRSLTAGDNAILYPMIHESNNEDASAVLGAVGESAVIRVAHEAGMRDYVPGIGWWAFSQTSAADQARFFWELPRLIPSRFYSYARGLMAGIEPEQSWGFPPVARPRWQVFFKTGALPSAGLFNEAARLERGGVTFTVAVLTNGDPSMAYGEETIQGVDSRLLAHTP